MKNLILIFTVTLILATPAFSELSDSDLQRIREVVKLEVNGAEQRLRSEMKTTIAESEKQIKEYVNTKMSEVNIQFKQVNDRIDELGKRINIVFTVLGWLFMLVLAAIGLPQLITAFRQRGQDELRTELKELRAEIELLKQSSKPHPESS
jgi:ribosomal protein S20